MVMPTPTASAFPAASGLFPASPTASDPMFGVNPYSPGTGLFGQQTQFIDPTVSLPDVAQRHAMQMQQIQMAQLASLGLAPATDPHTWTPDEAAKQTDDAIARIGVANPDLAKQLAEQRAPTGEDDGSSFWDSLKHVAGDLLSPALNIGGKVLDIIGRTAYLVPNVAFDLADGGETDVWGDVAGALTGNVKHNWNSVFQEMGWEGDGLGGFLRATVGFAADIGTDPLTWLIPAGAAVKGAEGAALTAEVAATTTESLTAEGAKLFGDKAGETMLTNYRRLLGTMEEQGVKLGESDTAERVAGIFGEMNHSAETELLKKQFYAADQVYAAKRARSLQALLKGKGVTDEAGNLIASSDELKTAFNSVVQAGTGAASGSTEWSQARKMASALGGTRFKVATPWTNLRYISPAIPGSQALSEKTLGVISRMASGQSGMNRMVQYISEHPEEGWAPMKTWMEEGFDAALEKHPEVVNSLRGKFKNMGSMFYSGSEQIGRITAHFDSASAATRAGLMGYAANVAKVNADNARNLLIRETAYQVTDRAGNRVDRQTFVRQLESVLGVSYRKKKNTATYGDLERFADYLDTFPPELDTSSPDAIRAWWDSQPQHAIGPQTAEEAAGREDNLRRALQVAEEVTPAQRQVLDQVSAVWDHVRAEVAKKDASLGDVRFGFGQAGKLTKGQADQAAAGSIIETTVYHEPRSAQAGQRVAQNGLDESSVDSVGDFVGVHFTLTKDGAPTTVGATPSRIKVSSPIYIDESEAGSLLDQSVADADNAARQALDSQQPLVDAAVGRPSGGLLSEKEKAIKRAEMITEKVRKEHPEADSVIIRNADGSAHIVVFDHRNVWAVDDSAANLVAERGFFHRTLTRDTKEWLRGRAPQSGNKLLIAEPELEAFLRRQTIHMNRREAETWMRDYLTRLYGAEGLPDQIWDHDLLAVHDHYIKGMGDAIVSEMLGKQSRRFVRLGDLAPALFGNAPRDQRYEWMMNPALLKSLQNKDSKLTDAIMRSHEADYRRMEAQHNELAKTAEQYGMLAAMVEENLGYGLPVPDRLTAAARKYGATVHEAQSALEKQVDQLDKTESHLVDQLHAHGAAMASLPEEAAEAHPRSADIITTANEDGTTSVKGWHYSQSGAGVEPVREVNPEELGSAGFHIGSYDQAKYLADRDAEAAGKTIGSRDGHDWPVDVDVYAEGADPRTADSVWSDSGMNVRRRADQSVEDYAKSAAGEPNGTVVVRPTEPDVFYEDVIQPIEARGKFAGADTPLVEGGTEQGDNALGMSFTGSGAGESSIKAQERGLLAARDGGGTQGAIYQNAVEGDARSLVVLDPRDGNVVWNATTGSGSHARFLRDVADGKVFLKKDGTLTLKREAGSRRLKPQEVIEEQLGKVRAERDTVNELRTRLAKGGEAVESLPVPGDVTEAAGQLGRAVAATAKRESQAQLAAGKRLEKLRRNAQTAMGEANKAYAEYHGAVAAVKPSLVKVETAGNLGGLTRLHIPGLEGFAMPAYVAEEFHQLVDTHGIGHLRTSWRKYVMGPWKRWATYRWPGFHVRNFFGAFFNNWLGGVVERDYIFSWRVNHARDGHLKWADRVVSDWEHANYNLAKQFDHRPTYADVADLLGQQGVGRANTMAVMGIGNATEAVHEVYEAVGKNNGNKLRSGVRKADDFMREMGSSVEDFHRVAAWGRGMAASNGDAYGARAFVMMRHGDYADLTGAEDFVRDLVPFYKWQRTNIPYQIRMLAENPAKLSLVHDKIPGYAYDAEGIDRRTAELQQPDWMKESTSIPIPDWVPVIGSKGPDALKFAMFDLPYSDLYNGLNDYMSSALPVVRNVLESYGFKQTLFSGKALEGKYVPLSGVFNLPGVRDILSAAGLARKGANNTLYIEDRKQNVLMAWPIFSRFRNFTESDPTRVDSRIGGLMSMIAGVSVRSGDYTQSELDFFYNEVQPLLDQYKSLGINLPSIDDIQSGTVGAAVGLYGGSGLYTSQPALGAA